MRDDFNKSTYLSQVRKLRELAIDTLKEYPIKDYQLKFINHGENTTYKVITKSQSYLLRIHCRSHRTKEAFLEELKWLDSLSRKTSIPVQRPLKTKKGRLIVFIGNSYMGHSRYCDVLHWQEGYIKNKKNADVFFQVGKLIGELQKNTISSKYRHYWDSKGLIGENATLGGLPKLSVAYPRHERDLESLRAYLYRKLSRYEKKYPKRSSLIHADLHFGNMVWNKGVVQPIDFDDCGHGLEMYDLGVTLAQSSHYFKSVGKKQAGLSKENLLNGYQVHKELSVDDLKILPYFVAVRELAMIGWLYERRDNPELANYLKKNIAMRIKKARQYIEQAEANKYF